MPMEARRGCWILGAGIETIVSCPMWVCKPDLSLQVEQQALLAAEPAPDLFLP